MTSYSEPRVTLHILTLAHILTNLPGTYKQELTEEPNF
jgi:hypothetical protein